MTTKPTPRKRILGPAKQKVIINKVRPYPIPAEIKKKSKPNPIKGDIRRLTEHGCLLMSVYDYYRIGEVIDITCSLPVLKSKLELKAKVVKSYQPVETHAKGLAPNVVMLEVHFISATPEQMATIKNFREKIGQKD